MDDQKLWNLLGHSPRPAAPPFFTGKVLRRIEAAKSRPAWFAPVLRWLAPATVAALVLLATVPRPGDPAPAEFTTLDLVEMLSPEDHQVLVEAGWPYNNGFLSAAL